MSIVTVPAGLVTPAECTISQARYDVTESSDSTGSEAARLLGPPRWRMSLRSPDVMTLAQAGQWEAMLLQLRGRVNHLAMYDPVRIQPVGTLRGVPTLASTAAAGATSLTLSGATSGKNLLAYPGFELDVNLDAMADGWSAYSSGGASSTPGGLYPGNLTPYCQQMSVDNLHLGQAGIVASNYAAVNGSNGYTFAIDTAATSILHQVNLRISWYTAGHVFISGDDAASAATTSWSRHTLYALAPPTAALAVVYVWLVDLAGYAISFAAYFDNAQLELGGAATAFDGAATLKAGDWLQLGSGLGTSQLVKVTADATANDAAAMAVTVEPPLRQAFTAGAVVTWYKPVAHYRQTSEPQWAYRPGAMYKQGQFALDLLESWA